MDVMIILLLIALGGRALGQDEFLGCFESSSSVPDLPVRIRDIAVTEPSGCIRECHSRYYMYAGLMLEQCFCGSKYGRNGPSTACTNGSDKNLYFGTHDAISVYATGHTGPSPPRRIQVYRSEPCALQVTWEPPDIPNGNITSYAIRAVALRAYSSMLPPPVEVQVQGGSSNTTTLRGLQAGTEYNISVVASNVLGVSESGFAFNSTFIGPASKPDTPRIVDKSDTTITVDLSEGRSENGPVTSYQVIVVRPGTIPPMSNDTAYPDYEKSTQDGLGYYVTGEFDVGDFQMYKKFTIGDGRRIGGHHNAPLEAGTADPQLGLVVVSKTGDEIQYSYSDLTSGSQGVQRITESEPSQVDPTVIGLCVAIIFLGALLLVSILTYFVLRRRHGKRRMRRHPEQQELTLQGPVYEVDNMAYIPEDVPERTNHYQQLKKKVWNIPRNFLTIDAVVIRRGRFGTVHMGTVQKDGIPSTVTVHSIPDGLLRAMEKKMMLRELDVCIRAGTTKHLAGLVGTCETPDTLYVVMEMPPQTLKNRLLAARSCDPIPTDQILLISVAVASALQYLEHQKIVHARLCSRSVGLCNDKTPKLMGHGIAKYALEDMKYIRWTALECLNSEKNHQKGVVWAFGVLLWEILSMGGTPYANLPDDSAVEDAVRRGIRLPQLRDIPDPLYEVMLSCWQQDPEERPTFDELVRLDTLSICPITAVTEPYIPEMELN